VFDDIHIYYLACSCYFDKTTGKTHLKIILYSLPYNKKVFNLMMAYIKAETCSCWDKLCKNPLSNINITSRVWLYCTHIMILYNTTELSHLKKITIQLKIPMNIGLLKRSFRVAASWRLKKMLTVRLEMRCRMLHVWTVVALLAGKFKMSHELFHVHSIFTVSMPGRHWLPWPM